MIKMKYKSLIILFFLFAIAGCKSRTASNDVIVFKETDKTSDVISIEAKKTIIFASGFENRANIIDLIKKYNKKNKDTTVVYQELVKNENIIKNKIYDNFEDESFNYDIICVENTWIPEISRKGYIENLSIFIHEDNYNINSFLDSTINFVTFDSKVWGIPKEIKSDMMFYNSDIVNFVPKTWDELINIDEHYDEIGDNQYFYGVVAEDDKEIFYQMLEIIYSYGGTFINYYGEVSINNEALLNGLIKSKDMFNSKKENNNNVGLNNKKLINDFISGKSLFLRSNPDGWNVENNIYNEILTNYYMTILPKSEVGTSSLVDGKSLVIHKKSSNKKEAWEFIKFLAEEENQKEVSIETGKLPVLKSLYKDSDVINKLKIYDSELVLNYLNKGKPTIKSEKYNEVYKVLVEEFKNFLYNDEIEPEEIINLIEIKLNEVYN